MDFFRMDGKTTKKNREAWMLVAITLLSVLYGCFALAQDDPFALGVNAGSGGSPLVSPPSSGPTDTLVLPENPNLGSQPGGQPLFPPADSGQNTAAPLPVGTDTLVQTPSQPQIPSQPQTPSQPQIPAQVPAAQFPPAQAQMGQIQPGQVQLGQIQADPAPQAQSSPAQQAMPAQQATPAQQTAPAQPNPYLSLMCRPEYDGNAAIGEECTLEDILRGVTAPRERFRLTDEYWQLTGALIRCNLAAIYANDVAACVGLSQGQVMDPNAEALWISEKRLADEAKRDARIAFVTAQYRCAALGKRTASDFRPEMLPVPVDPPTVDSYNTRADEIARNRTFTARASMLNQRIPYQYSAVCAYRAAVAESLSAFAALYNTPNCSAPRLLAALKRHTEDKRKLLDAVIVYNRLIAEYVAETVGSQIQGDRLLMTLNQSPKKRTAGTPAYRMADTGGSQIIRGQEFQPAPRGRGQSGGAIGSGASTRPSLSRAPGMLRDSAPQNAAGEGATILRSSNSEPVPRSPLPPASSSPASSSPVLSVPALSPPANSVPEVPSAVPNGGGLALPFEIPSAGYLAPAEDVIIRGQMPDTPPAAGAGSGSDMILSDTPLLNDGGSAVGVPAGTGEVFPPPAQGSAPSQNPVLPQDTTAQPQNPVPPQDTAQPQNVVPPQNAAQPQNVVPPQNAVQLQNTVPPPARGVAQPQDIVPPQVPQQDIPQFDVPSQTIPSALPPDGNAAVPTQDPSSPPSGAPAGGTSASYAKPRSESQKAEALRQTRSLADLLFSIKSSASGAGEGDIVEIPLSLSEMLSYVGDVNRRVEAVDSYWHLRVLIASLAVETKTLETVDRLIASLGSATGEAQAVLPTVQSYRQGTLGRVAELRGLIRAAQTELMRRSGRTPEIGWPIPSSAPCLGPYNLESGGALARNFELLTQTVLIPEKIDAVWDTALSLGTPESLFVPEIVPDGTVDGTNCYLDILENKRLAVIAFLDEIESLNGSIVRYVDAFSPSPLPSETYVHCLIGE